MKLIKPNQIKSNQQVWQHTGRFAVHGKFALYKKPVSAIKKTNKQKNMLW